MQIPLHLDTYAPLSMQNDLARLEHHSAMMNLNPKGFRNHRTGKHKNQQRDTFCTPIENIANRVYGVPAPANDNSKFRKRTFLARIARRIMRRAA